MDKLSFNIFPNVNFIDLCMYQFGHEQCEPAVAPAQGGDGGRQARLRPFPHERERALAEFQRHDGAGVGLRGIGDAGGSQFQRGDAHGRHEAVGDLVSAGGEARRRGWFPGGARAALRHEQGSRHRRAERREVRHGVAGDARADEVHHQERAGGDAEALTRHRVDLARRGDSVSQDAGGLVVIGAEEAG